MRIEDLRSEKKQNVARVAATVVWEDCDRPTQEVYFEADEAFAQHLCLNPHAFLVGCLVPALCHGEERIAIDELICPELRNGLITIMRWLQAWYGCSPDRPVRIEAKPGTRPPRLRSEQRAGIFLSGGLDSLALLQANRLDFPTDHPRSFKDGLVVYGFDFGGHGTDRQIEPFERALASVADIAQDADLRLIPVYTNVRHLDDDVTLWMQEFHGAALAAVAHAFSNRLTRVEIASTAKIPQTLPWGSHPLLDPNYGSTDLQLWHNGLRYSRLEKAELVAGWDAALKNIRVCNENLPGALNCGRCEKCVRTMLEFLAVGKLNRASAFVATDVSRELLEEVLTVAALKDCVSEYTELIDPLIAQGRSDLAQVIQDRFRQLDKFMAWKAERDWKGYIKRLDRRFLGSALFQSYKALRERTPRA